MPSEGSWFGWNGKKPEIFILLLAEPRKRWRKANQLISEYEVVFKEDISGLNIMGELWEIKFQKRLWQKERILKWALQGEMRSDEWP